MKQFWDNRYRTKEYIYGRVPNRFFRHEIGDFEKPGKILLPAEGEGRNAVYAAELGWQVTAFDISAEAQKKAFQLALKKGISISYYIESFESFVDEIDTFDCIALIYCHLPSSIRSTIHSKILSYLKPGGKLILEAFSKEQIKYKSGGPANTDMLYSIEDLNKDFSSLNYLEIFKKEVYLSEGRYHNGDAMVVRLTGIKKT